MVSILDKLADKQGNSIRSSNWYKNAISSFTSNVTASRLMREGKLTSRPSIGLLNMFFYDPKYKKTLPVYDRFPLVLPLEPISGGFSGLNFHYLPPVLRLRLLELMQQWATNNKLDSTTRFDVSWSRVKNINLVKPTIKKYLFKHVLSSYLKIDLTQAAIACYLPVQQFVKQSAAKVYRTSRGMI
jgi:hypothetical protein